MKFAKAYEKRWGLEPEGYGTSSSHMAVYTLKEAIEKAGSIDSDAVITALENVNLMGVYGKIASTRRATRSSRPSTPPRAPSPASSSGRRGSGSRCSRPRPRRERPLLPPWMK